MHSYSTGEYCRNVFYSSYGTVTIPTAQFSIHTKTAIMIFSCLFQAHCKECQKDLGVILLTQNVQWPCLKIESLIVVLEDERIKCKKWSKAPFKIQKADLEELHRARKALSESLEWNYDGKLINILGTWRITWCIIISLILSSVILMQPIETNWQQQK